MSDIVLEIQTLTRRFGAFTTVDVLTLSINTNGQGDIQRWHTRVVMPKAAPAKIVRVETKLRLGNTSVYKRGGIEAPGSRSVVTETREPIVKAQAGSSRR
jgi:hypothetical protein